MGRKKQQENQKKTQWVRFRETDLAMIDRAAAVVGKLRGAPVSRASFCAESTLTAARAVLEDRNG